MSERVYSTLDRRCNIKLLRRPVRRHTRDAYLLGRRTAVTSYRAHTRAPMLRSAAEVRHGRVVGIVTRGGYPTKKTKRIWTGASATAPGKGRGGTVVRYYGKSVAPEGLALLREPLTSMSSVSGG